MSDFLFSLIFMIYIDFISCSVICVNCSTDCFTSPFTVLTRKYPLDVNNVGDKIGLEMAKLASVPSVLPSYWKPGKHFPFLYFKRTAVILHDYTGNRNFHSHDSECVCKPAFKQMPTLVFTVALSAVDYQYNQ